jgi:hypothetical protein
MKLLKIRDKYINWDLVTDVQIVEKRDGGKNLFIQFGSHRLRLDVAESLGFEKWMKNNHQIEEIELVQPRYKSPDQILREKEAERQRQSS